MVSGNSLAVHWLGLRAFTAKGLGSIPGWGTKIPKAAGVGGSPAEASGGSVSPWG